MADQDREEGLSRYYRMISPSEIKINKEEIFYRDKYNEIINYIKLILADARDLEIYEYLQPKGSILINIMPGTDIIDFLKLISSNYYLNFIELNYAEIIKSPDDFFNNFYDILKEITIEREDNSGKKDIVENDDEKRKKLIIINLQNKINSQFKGKSLLHDFTSLILYNDKGFDFIDENSIFIWINYNQKEILEFSDDLFRVFDFLIKIPVLNSIERETIFKNFSEKYPKIVFDINALINYTENWEIKDLKQLIRVAIFKHHLNTDLNETSNEITDVLISLIESGEYIPAISINNIEEQNSTVLKLNNQNKIKTPLKKEGKVSDTSIDVSSLINEIREEGISEFMLNQLYENAASKNYSELIVIIDKLNNKDVIEENDRKILAKYSFILNDPPNRALINLEKAKKRVDLIKQAFGK